MHLDSGESTQAWLSKDMSNDFTDKYPEGTVFVTGGSKGIGQAVVLSFAERGIPSVFTYNTDPSAGENTISLAKKINADASVTAYKIDLSIPEAIEPFVERLFENHPHFSTLVCNAGVLQTGPAIFLPNDVWERTLATNLTSPFYLMRSFLSHFMGHKKGGRIISISSIAEHGASGQAAYAASKAALSALTVSIAKEYGPKKITANVISPGYIETDMTSKGTDARALDFWKTFCPLKRAGQPNEVSEIVCFLASKAASFINGQVINASGGLNVIP